MKIHFLKSLKPDEIDFFERSFEENVVFSFGKEAEASDETALLIGGSPRQEDLNKFPNAKTVFVPWAGVPVELREILADQDGYQVYNLHHNARNTAEFGVTMMVSVMKQVIPYHLALQKNDWEPRYNTCGTQVLAGKEVLMLGWGHIAKHAARMCEGLGMHVTALNRSSKGLWMDETVKVDSIACLDAYLPMADVVFLALPLTSETEGLIDARRLGLMKKTAYLVTVARGPVVVEKDFYEALRDGVIAGAGIDVWYQYPKGKDSAHQTAPSAYPFGELQNVVLSPHRGGMAEDYDGFTNDETVRFVHKFASGQLDEDAVDLSLGY